jgi:hypothetical protein
MTRLDMMQPETYLGYYNPSATDYIHAPERGEAVARYFVPRATGSLNIETGIPDTESMAALIGDCTVLLNPDGGDGTVRKVVSAALGIEENDPNGTDNNFARHRKLVQQIILFANAGGNGNNFPLSAHGSAARDPRKLFTARHLVRAQHRPLTYTIMDERGGVTASGIALTGIGIGSAATAAARIELAKPQLNSLSLIPRLASEASMIFSSLYHEPSFGLEITDSLSTGVINTSQLESIVGFELIGSKVYAKRGRTHVNVDDTRWQPVAVQQHETAVGRTSEIVGTAVRLNAGMHARNPIDLRNRTLTISPETDQAVPIHADGETGPALWIHPGQKLQLKLANLAIPFALFK